MNVIVEAINAAGRAFVGLALPMLVQTSLLVVILLLVDLVLRRRVRAVFRYWIWMLVLVKLVLPPSLWSPVSIGTWFGDTLTTPTVALLELEEPESAVPPAAAAEPPSTALSILSQAPPLLTAPAIPHSHDDVDISPVSVENMQSAGGQVDTAEAPAGIDTPAPPVRPQAVALNWRGLVLLCWTAIAAALLLLLLQRAFFVRGLIAQAQEADPAMRETLEECRRRIGLRGSVTRGTGILPVGTTGVSPVQENGLQGQDGPVTHGQDAHATTNQRFVQPLRGSPAIKVSPNASSPAVCGLIRPVILIPQNLATRLEGADLRAVLLHELAHVRRGDLWINLAQTLLQVVYFYNPFLWLANAMIRRTREQAVDEAVLVAMGDAAQQYPETLLNVARLAFKRRPALSLRLIGVVESKSALTSRIKHMLSRPLPKTARLGLLGLTVIVLTAAVLLPMAKGQEQDVLSRLAILPNCGVWMADIAGQDLPVLDLASERIIEFPVVEKEYDLLQRTSSEGRGDILYYYDEAKHAAKITFLRSAGLHGEPPSDEYETLTVTPMQMPFETTLTARDGDRFKISIVRADAEACSIRFRPLAGGRDTFRAVLPENVTVELVGVCEYPNEGRQWWGPDGETLREVPCTRNPRDKVGFVGSDERVYEIAFRFGRTDGLDLQWHAEGTPGHMVVVPHDPSTGATSPQMRLFVAHFPKTQRTAQIQIDVRSEGGLAQSIRFEEISLRPGRRTDARIFVESHDTDRGAGGGALAGSGETVPGETAKHNMQLLGIGIVLYANEHNGVLPATLAPLKPYVGDAQAFAWLRENVIYAARGNLKDFSAPHLIVTICEAARKASPPIDDRYVVFLDGHAGVADPQWVNELGLEDMRQSLPQVSPEPAERSMTPTFSSKGVTVKLANGVTATLLALFSGYNVNDLQWWYPDGTPIPPERVAEFRKHVSGFMLLRPQRGYLQPCDFGYLLQVSGPDDMTVRTGLSLKGSTIPGFRLKNVPGPYATLVWRDELHGDPPLPEVLDLKVVAASGPYRRVESDYDSERGYLRLQDGDYRFMISSSLSRMGLQQDYIDITADRDDVDIDLRYYDIESHTQNPQPGYPFPAHEGPGPLFTWRLWTPVPPEHILLDYRPAGVAVFKNVSLRPGRRTSVEVEARSPATAASGPPGPGPLARHALSFDGVDDRLIVPPSPSLTLKPPFTIEVWFKPDPEKELQRMSLLQKGRRPTDPEKIQEGGFFVCGGRPRDSKRACWGTLLLGRSDGRVWQGDAFGADTVLDQPGWGCSLTRCTDNDYVPVPDQPLLIGNDFVGEKVPLKGEIAEIRIWNKGLTDGEAHWYGTMSLTGNEPNLVACWDFERQPGGQIVYDISPNANHAYLGTSKDKDDADPKWIDLSSESQVDAVAEQKERVIEQGETMPREAVKHNMLQLGLGIVLYANEHNGELPTTLAPLEPYVGDAQAFAWLRENVIYTAKGNVKDYRAPHSTMIAREAAQKASPPAGEQYVLFLDAHVELAGPQRLKELNLENVQQPPADVLPRPDSAQPALGLRIAPKRSDLDAKVVREYVTALQTGQPTRDRDLAWFEVRPGTYPSLDAITENHAGKTWLLAWNKKPFIMLPTDGWTLKRVEPSKDAMDRPAITVQFDAKGSGLLYRLTQANAKRTVAIIVDGKVVSAPTIMHAIADTVMIVGSFTEQEVERLVAALSREAARTVMLNMSDHWQILDLATGVLISTPRSTPPSTIRQALQAGGKGDLLYDHDDVGPKLLLVRGATSDQAQQVPGDSFISQAYRIGQALPETLTVTTAESKQYSVTILAPSDTSCLLRYSCIGIGSGTDESALGASERPVSSQAVLQRLLDQARPGSTVMIPKGRYTEPIEVNKPMVLRGESQEECVIEITADRPAVLLSTGGKGDVTLENVTIRWQRATDAKIERPVALLVKDSRALIRNCRFEPLGDYQRSPMAVYIDGFSEATVDNCRFNGFEYTVCYGPGTKGVVQDCIITDCGHQGVINYANSTLTVQRCIITGSKFHAVRCTGGTLNVKDNLLVKNANRGIYLGNKSGRGSIMNNLILGNGTGVSGFGQATYVIANNVIVDNSYAGIDMRDSCRLDIHNNIVAKNPRGVMLFKEGTRNYNVLGENLFWSNGTDIENFDKPADPIKANPQFADPNSGDFSVQGPAKDRGHGLTDPRIIKDLWRKYEQLQREQSATPAQQASPVMTPAPAPPPAVLAWRRTDRYVPPDANSFFPDDPEAGKRLDALFRAGDRDGCPDEEILSTVRQGFRRTVHSHNSVLQWIGNRFIWGKDPQNPEAIELMYHAIPLERYYAVYSGLSVVKGKSPNLLRALAEICMQGEQVGRITWGLGDQREQILLYITPYLQDTDPKKRETAEMLLKHFKGELDFEKWQQAKRVEQVKAEFTGQLPQLRESLLTGDSQARRGALTTITRNGLAAILDDSFLPAVRAAATDSDSSVRNEAARLLGGHWVWRAEDQNPNAIESLLTLSSDSNREVRYSAVYFGLSTVRDKSETIVRRLVEMALADHEGNLYGRIVWGLQASVQDASEAFMRILSEHLDRAGSDLHHAAAVYTLHQDVLKIEPPEKWNLARIKEWYPDDLFGVLFFAKGSFHPQDANALWDEFAKSLPQGVTAERLLLPGGRRDGPCIAKVRGKAQVEAVKDLLENHPRLSLEDTTPLSLSLQLYFEEMSALAVLRADSPSAPAQTGSGTSSPSPASDATPTGPQTPGPIQQRIDAAAPGATIRLEPGVYKERLVINKPLTLEGAGWDKTTVMVENEKPPSPEEAERILKERMAKAQSDAERAEIAAQVRKEFLAKLSPTVLSVQNAKGVVVRGIKFSSPSGHVKGVNIPLPIVDVDHSSVDITDCAVLAGPGGGIQVKNGSEADIDRTLVAAVWGTGISVASEAEPSRAHIHDSDIRNCHYAGIRVGRGAEAVIERCRISGAAWHGVRYDDVSPTLQGNLIFGNARCGVYASGKTTATVKNNLLYDNEMTGMSCWFQNQDVIEGNTFAGNERSGLEILGASKPIVARNIFYSNPTGVHVGDVADKSPFAKSDGQVALEENLFWANKDNVLWLKSPDAKRTVALDEKSVVADPQFTAPSAGDFSVPTDSPARAKGIGAAGLIPLQSPWPLQPEELAIIPKGDTRDSEQWRHPN